MLIRFGLAAVLACLSLSASAEEFRPGRVLAIGIDGTRPDALFAADTPHLDALIADGAVDWHTQVDYLTYSGPNWTSMLNGTWCDKHKVDSNDFPRDDLATYPHFFWRVKEQRPDALAGSFVNWPQINRNILKNRNADWIVTDVSDDMATEEAVRVLENEDPDVVFVALDDVDGRGHACCFDPENSDYLAEISVKDALVGQLVAAMKARPNYEDENWLVVMTTDHGGTDTNHGEDIPTHRTTWFVTSGPNSAPIEPGSSRVTDFAVTAMAHLGLDIKEEWGLDGIPRGIKGDWSHLERREAINTCYVTDEDRAYLLTREYQEGLGLLTNHTLREALGLLCFEGNCFPHELVPDTGEPLSPADITLEELANRAGVSLNELVQAFFEAAGVPLYQADRAFLKPACDTTGFSPDGTPFCK